ncbi:MAG: glycosyltransferase family 9 protein [Vicinamibacterales bacterium]
MNILIVRLGALGDLVHAVPAAAALRAAWPDARIDWLVDARHRSFLDLVNGLDRVVTLDGRSLGAWADVVKRLRQGAYDVALDFQGLMKSAILARASGARRVAGFSIWHLREKGARPFYSETVDGGGDRSRSHVIDKNLRLLRVVGVTTDAIVFPLADVRSNAVAQLGDGPFALINPGAAWPNKQWSPERFGEIAAFLRDIRGLRSIVLWGPGEAAIASAVVDASRGAARLAPATTIPDIIALARAASLMISGDTGPLHLAGAVGTPIVAIFGPTDPHRNGPWSADDVVVSRYAGCECHYQRHCRAAAWCLDGVTVAEVSAAILQRLATTPVASRHV